MFYPPFGLERMKKLLWRKKCSDRMFEKVYYFVIFDKNLQAAYTLLTDNQDKCRKKRHGTE